MIPLERRAGEPLEFPFLGPAVMVLALHAILAVTLPPTLIRSAVALVAFFGMGYAALALIVDGHVRLSAAEVLAFTVGLTILLTSLSALAVSIVGIKITEFAVVIIGLPIGVLAWLLRRPRTRPWTVLALFARSYFDFSDYSRGEKGIAAILLALIAIALGVFISLAFVHYPDQPTNGIAWSAPNPEVPPPPPCSGAPIRFNGTFCLNRTQQIDVTVFADNVGGSFTLRVRLVPPNASANATFTNAPFTVPAPGNVSLRLRGFAEYREPFTVAAGGTFVRTFLITMEELGTFDLKFELLDRSSTVVAGSQIPARVVST